MEKLMSPSFFKSENVTEMYSDIITTTLPMTRHMELPEPVNFTVYHKKMDGTPITTGGQTEGRMTQAALFVLLSQQRHKLLAAAD
ncbi:hypothetical protein SKAU_G00366800 [Synaphobranchus kaupii]|uniref:Uncharacterized protein n=1 Tax=Synaphobranchus kaupii TaxID=118154 RepID=A0A9Q1EF99_SYNKA|nr:hypothetical protein SKAU_G00366800 [Synaphobranchus kaupii]